MRILGIDPGLNITGYGVLRAEHLGKPRAQLVRGGRHPHEGRRTDLAARVREIYEGVARRSSSSIRPKGIVVVEQLYAHYKHPRTAILMGHARGVALLAASRHDAQVLSYSATRIKKTITGHGHATKEQMQRTIQAELGLAVLPEPPDVADAARPWEHCATSSSALTRRDRELNHRGTEAQGHSRQAEKAKESTTFVHSTRSCLLCASVSLWFKIWDEVFLHDHEDDWTSCIAPLDDEVRVQVGPLEYQVLVPEFVRLASSRTRSGRRKRHVPCTSPRGISKATRTRAGWCRV